MKKVIFLLLLVPLPSYCQIMENFESGTAGGWNFSHEGSWSADTASISGNYSLHHVFDNPAAGSDQASISIRDLHPDEDTVQWSFLIRHGCDPSSSNNWAVFLMSDSDPGMMIPGNGMKGFAVGVNVTGSDDTLRLWKIDGANIIRVVNSRINWQNDIGTDLAIRISVTRTQAGEWTMLACQKDGRIIDLGSGADISLTGNEWFGVFYKYSSTRDRLLWIDDVIITGTFYEDAAPPSVTGFRVTGKSSVEISFSEEPSPGSFHPGNFMLNGNESRPVIIKKAPLTYSFSFYEAFINKAVNRVQIEEICDDSGNCGPSDISFTPVFPEPGDVIITEVMADPEPAVSLPPSEYIEISNRTEFPFNLGGWSLVADGRSEVLPGTVLPAKGRSVICSAGFVDAFSGHCSPAGLKHFPSLNDTRMKISLCDSTGVLVHGIEYDRKWYDSQLKASGGWSLEMTDEKYPFFEEGNWSASGSRTGGTPGQTNSVARDNPDENFRGIINVFPESPVLIRVDFSEYVQNIDSLTDLSLDKGIRIKSVSAADQLRKSFIIETDRPLEQGTVYLLRAYNTLVDFAGNPVERNGFNFGLAEPPAEKDILFNELLFNPLPGEPDFIEFFNNSGTIIDASRLYVTTVNESAGDTSSLVQLSEEHRCINPMTFFVITTDRKKLISRYFSSDPDVIFEVSQLPPMNDDKGHLVLFSRELDRIDEIYYDDEMHYRMLDETEGISLERVSPSSLSSSRTSWHSASESSGWATPGTGNSVYMGDLHAAEEINMSSGKISPDNDGFEDVLKIYLYSREIGNILSVTIFDETGSLVRKLSERLLAGAREELIWDGTSDDGSLLRPGIYIIFCEMYNATGKVRRWKKVCAVVR